MYFLFIEPFSSCPWPRPILTDIQAGSNVSAMQRSLEIVIFVINLQSPDTSDKSGVKTEEAPHVPHFPHAAHVERLVECDPREEALVIKILYRGSSEIIHEEQMLAIKRKCNIRRVSIGTF